MKILVALSRFPWPLEKGDKLRAYHMIRHLAQEHEIILFAISDQTVEKSWIKQLEPYCSHISVFHKNKVAISGSLLRGVTSPLPFQVAYFYSGAAQKQLDQLVAATQPDAIYCQLIRMAEYVRRYPQHKVLDYMDAFSKGIERRFKSEPLLLKPMLKIEYNKVLAYEGAVFNDFQRHCIISAADRELIRHPFREQIKVIPNGVDQDYFAPDPERQPAYDLVFTGNMGYAPNVAAAEFFGSQLLPLLNKKRPGLRLLIAGASPARKVLKLAEDYPQQVTVTGWVDDIRTCYNNARVFAAPLFLGTGLQNKLLEAMAMQLPCVSTHLVNGALGASSGEEILLANNADEFANHILYLLDHPEVADEIARRGFTFVKNNYNWARVTSKVAALLQS